MCLVQTDILGTVANLRHVMLSLWMMDWVIFPKVLEIVRYSVCNSEYLKTME